MIILKKYIYRSTGLGNPYETEDKDYLNEILILEIKDLIL